MGSVLINISSSDEGFYEFSGELAWELRDQGTVYAPLPSAPPGERTPWVPPEVLVLLGSASAFTALSKIICKYIELHKDRELKVKTPDKEIIIKGHFGPEDVASLKKELFPESS